MTSIERPVGQWLQLPDVTGFGDILKRYGFWNRATMPDLKLGRNILRKLTAWLAEATGDTDATIAGCSHFLFHRVLSITRGDLGAALLLTGRAHSHGSSVIHYSHYRESMLVGTYHNAFCNQWNAHATGNESRVDIDSPEQGFGARRVPTLQAVCALTSGLKKGVIEARKGNEHVRWHNLYTAYTLLGFVLGLALRAISDPHLIDLSAVLATFTDKARTDYHRRVVAWAALLVEHAKHYAEFRNIVRARAGEEALPAEIAFAYQDPETGHYEPFRPKHFRMVVGELFPLEMYALRRFVRTSLLENDRVDAEDIDAWLGHWFTGVGPHDKRSAYPVMRLVEMANGPVTELLRATGFEPMRSIA